MNDVSFSAPTLETARLVLRAFRGNDFDEYADMLSDAETMRYLGEGKPMSREDAWRNLAMVIGHWHLRGFGLWAVDDRETGTLVGRVGFFQPEGWPGFEIGWTIARPHWGKGYATEAAKAVLQHGFLEMKRDHIISLIDLENHASIRVAEKVGEQLDRTIEFKGKSIFVYGIRRETWKS